LVENWPQISRKNIDADYADCAEKYNHGLTRIGTNLLSHEKAQKAQKGQKKRPKINFFCPPLPREMIAVYLTGDVIIPTASK